MASRHARAIIAAARRELAETNSADPLGNLWSDLDLLEWVNEGQNQVAAEIVKVQEDFFGYYFDINGQSGVAIYDLPERFMKARQVEYIVGGAREAILESRVTAEDPPVLSAALDPTVSTSFRYAIYGDQIHFDPAPNDSQSPMFRIWFIGEPAELTYGKAEAGAAQTITLQAADSADSSGAAAASSDHYYDQTFIVLTGGAGSGQRQRITGYVGSTRVATVQSPWAVVPDATTLYSTETMVPKPMWRMMQLFAAVAAKQKYKMDSRALASRYNSLEDGIPAIFERRTSAERGIRAFDPWDGMF